MISAGRRLVFREIAQSFASFCALTKQSHLPFQIAGLGEELAQETVAMHLATSPGEDGLPVLLGAVTLVLPETVAGMVVLQLIHQAVPSHLGNNRCHRDAQGAGV